MTIRVITVGIGGASSAGKTTLADQLSAVLPECTIIHQDDYWSNPEDCAIHPIYNEPYLEDPPTAIKWPLFRTKVQQLKTANERPGIPKWPEDSDSDISDDNNTAQSRGRSPDAYGKLPNQLMAVWSQQFRELDGEYKSRGIQLKWYIVEGWHLYYDPDVVKELDVRLLVRCSNNVVRKRKEKRAWKQQDGSMRTDPPYYWDHFSYPAYVRSHSHLFQGDLETGPLSPEAEAAGVMILEGEGTKLNLSCNDLFQHAAASILLTGKSELESSRTSGLASR